jgi:hypothetical protein
MAKKEIPTYIESEVKGKFILNPEWVKANEKPETKATKAKASKEK